MQLLEHAPQFSATDASRIARELYALRASATPLPSERDQNFLLESETGEKFVLKIANALEDPALLDAQQQVMEQLSRHTSFSQRVLPAVAGETITAIQSSAGRTHLVRLVTYLPGIPLGEVKWHLVGIVPELGCDARHVATVTPPGEATATVRKEGVETTTADDRLQT